MDADAQLSLPPGSSGAPLIGEIREWLADPLVFARERADRYGPVWRTHLLGRPTVVLLEPAGNRFMLASGMQHFSWRAGWGRSMLRLMGGGLSLTDGPEHAARRAVLRPAFTHATLQDQIPLLDGMVRAACASWASQPQISALQRLKHLAFDVAAAVICGPLSPALAALLHSSFDAFTAGLFTPFPYPLPGTPYWRAIRAGRHLRQGLTGLVAARRRSPLPDAMDALSLLLAGQPERPDAAIVSDLLLLLWAGHDTVASLLTWVLLELARHPAELHQLRIEAAALGQSRPNATLLRTLPLLDLVLRECERLHPPAPGGFRGVVEPFSYGGYAVPAGWLAMYSSVYTHMDPLLWSQPERFNPARFAAPASEGKIPFSMVGFGGGPRICIGLALAQLVLRLTVLECVRSYSWELLPDQDLTPVWLPTNQPRSGLQLHVARYTPDSSGQI